MSSLRVSYGESNEVLFILIPGKNSNSWAFVDGLFGVPLGKLQNRRLTIIPWGFVLWRQMVAVDQTTWHSRAHGEDPFWWDYSELELSFWSISLPRLPRQLSGWNITLDVVTCPPSQIAQNKELCVSDADATTELQTGDSYQKLTQLSQWEKPHCIGHEWSPLRPGRFYIRSLIPSIGSTGGASLILTLFKLWPCYFNLTD